MNPDCRDGKHDACNGDGWDGEQIIPCVCPCHHDESPAAGGIVKPGCRLIGDGICRFRTNLTPKEDQA